MRSSVFLGRSLGRRGGWGMGRWVWGLGGSCIALAFCIGSEHCLCTIRQRMELDLS